MHIIFHINDILSDSWKFLMQVYEKSYNVCTTQIYFPYSTVTSACQGSGLACTRIVTIFRTLKYMQKRFRHQNKPFRYWNEINKSKSIATQLFYQHTPIDTLVYEKFVCYNHTTKYTDVPYEMTVGWAFVYVCERDRVKDFVYICIIFH